MALTPDDIRAVREKHADLIARSADPTAYGPILALAAELRLGNPEAFALPVAPEWFQNNADIETAVAKRFKESQDNYLTVTTAMRADMDKHYGRLLIVILVAAVLVAIAEVI
jgi:hypothetical protein